MSDLVALVTAAALFALALAYVAGCNRILRGANHG